MQRALLAAVLLGALAVSCPVKAQPDDPLAPARSGAVERLSPNVVARTCGQFTAYRFGDGGRIDADSIAILESDPELLLYGSEEVHVRDGMVCNRIGPEMFESLRFTVDGAPAPEDVSTQLRALFTSIFVGVEATCTRSTAQGDVSVTTVYADGVEQPDLADTKIWIWREDGFTLAARDAAGT
jgi:hypothetical protein